MAVVITEDDLVEYLPLQLEIIIAEAIEIFNEKPSDARLFLIDKRVITGSAKEFANFISTHSRLSKRRIGEYVGKDDPFNQEVCVELFSQYQLNGLMVDEAIRYLAKQLRLPGEAQQIDRILEKFANSYFAHNPKFSMNAETLYILFFSLIMLNTDLHNPSIPKHKKMKLQQFISNLRGINDGKDISKELLTSLYYRIKKNAISMNDEDIYESKSTEFIAPTKAGWMEKECFLSIWKKRWFILKDGCLYYFTTPLDDHPRAIIPMIGIAVHLIEDDQKRLEHSYVAISNEDVSQKLKIGRYERPTLGKLSQTPGGMFECKKKTLLLRCKPDEAVQWYELLAEECQLLNQALRLQRESITLSIFQPQQGNSNKIQSTEESVDAIDLSDQIIENEKPQETEHLNDMSTIAEESEEHDTPLDAGGKDPNDVSVWGNDYSQNHSAEEEISRNGVGANADDTDSVKITDIDVSGMEIVECDNDSIGDSIDEDDKNSNVMIGISPGSLKLSSVSDGYTNDDEFYSGPNSLSTNLALSIDSPIGDNTMMDDVGSRSRRPLSFKRNNDIPILHSAKSSPHLRHALSGSMKFFSTKYSSRDLTTPKASQRSFDNPESLSHSAIRLNSAGSDGNGPGPAVAMVLVTAGDSSKGSAKRPSIPMGLSSSSSAAVDDNSLPSLSIRGSSVKHGNVRRDSRKEHENILLASVAAVSDSGPEGTVDNSVPIDPAIIGLLRILNSHQAHAPPAITKSSSMREGHHGTNGVASVPHAHESSAVIGVTGLSQDVTVDGFVDFSRKLKLPTPLIQGWLQWDVNGKRNSEVHAAASAALNACSDSVNSSISKKIEKYFALYENADGEGPTLFCYANEEAAKTMQCEGIQTQQKYVRIKNVCSVHYSDPTLIAAHNSAKPEVNACNYAVGEQRTDLCLNVNISKFSVDNEEVTSPAIASDSGECIEDILREQRAAMDIAVSAFDNAVDYRLPDEDQHHHHHHHHHEHQLHVSSSSSSSSSSASRPPLPQPYKSPALQLFPPTSAISTEPFSPLQMQNSSISAPSTASSAAVAGSSGQLQPHIEIKTIDGQSISLFSSSKESNLSVNTTLWAWQTTLQNIFDQCQL